MRHLFFTAILLFSGLVNANTFTCTDNLPYGVPESRRSDTTLLCRTGYAVEHDNKAKIPLWVSYTLTPEETLGCFARSSSFRSDRALPEYARSTPKDYAKSDYDIGHMANAGDMRWSVQAEYESNFLSNTVPQLAALNRGPWKRLEDQTRAWVLERRTPILIYTGPIYSANPSRTIGKGRVTVPDAFWKVLVDQTTLDVVAFIYPAGASQGGPGDFRTSIQEVQRQARVVLPLPKKHILLDSIWPIESKSGARARSSSCALR